MQSVLTNPLPRPGWVVPVLVAATAVPTLVAFAIGGNTALGAAWASVSLILAGAIAIGGRSETIRLLRGEHDDERSVALENQALSVTSLVLTVALVGLFLAAGLRGENGLVYGALLLLGEATHVAALAVLSRRG